jgi:hypothetical protein
MSTFIGFSLFGAKQKNKTTTKCEPKSLGLFSNFSYDETTKPNQGITCTYLIKTTPDEDSGFYDIGCRFTNIPIDVAIEHIRAEYDAFNREENYPDYYKKSLGFPWMRVWLDDCTLDGVSIPIPDVLSKSGFKCVITTLTAVKESVQNNDSSLSIRPTR